MDKYYTPTIEEFHVGFECEHIQYQSYGHQINLDKTTEWNTTVINAYNLPKDKAGCSFFRVKYLDKEDIESFGFDFDKGDDVLMTFKKENICLGYRSKEHTLTIFSIDVNKDEYFLQLHVDRFAVNNITIKNKSELKKLLQQLKIIE